MHPHPLSRAYDVPVHQVWDQDIMSKDDHMGVVLIPISQIMEQLVGGHQHTHLCTATHQLDVCRAACRSRRN